MVWNFLPLCSFLAITCSRRSNISGEWHEMERKKEGERREPCFLLPAPTPSLFFLPTDTLFFVLSPLSECLEQATWRWLFFKKMVSAHCAVQCINHSLKLKKLVSVTVHLPLYSTVKYSLKSCSPSLTNNGLRVVCHFSSQKVEHITFSTHNN